MGIVAHPTTEEVTTMDIVVIIHHRIVHHTVIIHHHTGTPPIMVIFLCKVIKIGKPEHHTKILIRCLFSNISYSPTKKER